MARKVSVKYAIADCHYQRKMTLAEREELRRVGRENNATAGLVCLAHVQAAFNFEFDDIDIDVPLEELLVEAAKETPLRRVTLPPLWSFMLVNTRDIFAFRIGFTAVGVIVYNSLLWTLLVGASV